MAKKVRLFGTSANEYLCKLVEERGDGTLRALDGGGISLDSVKAWDKKVHKADGADIEIAYKAYLKPTDRQKREAAGAKAAGVDLRLMKGRLVDIRRTKSGDVQVLVTSGLRASETGGIPYRSLNLQKGCLLGLAINCSLGVSVKEAALMATGDARPEGDVPATPGLVGAKPGGMLVVAGAGVPVPTPDTSKLEENRLREIVRGELAKALPDVIGKALLQMISQMIPRK